MKEKALSGLKWLIPILLLLLGIFLYGFVTGHSFLGLILCGIAAVTVCYYVLSMIGKRHPIAAKVLRTVLSSLLLLGILAAGVTLALILQASQGQTDTQCEYIVVLGAKVNGTSPSLSLSERIGAARDYLAAHPNAIAVVSGGQGPDEGISEAQCMYNGLTAGGISPERIWMEDKATSTWENLNFSLDLIEEKTGVRPDTVGLVSSEYHLFRASLFARDCGVTAVGIPAQTSWLTLRINYYLREVAGVWHYIILGGQYHD